jgi:hypothetical protein
MIVKIFDLAAISKKFSGSHVIEERYITSDTNALLLGRDKFILTEYGSVHTIHDRGPGAFVTLKAGRMHPVTLEGGVVLTGDVSVSIPVEVLLAETPVREEEFSHFIHSVGARKERNFASLLESIRSIGLDPKDFSVAR